MAPSMGAIVVGIVLFHAITFARHAADVDGLVAIVLIEGNVLLLRKQGISCLAEAVGVAAP
jgi:hypothetical protein